MTSPLPVARQQMMSRIEDARGEIFVNNIEKNLISIVQQSVHVTLDQYFTD